MLTVSKPMTVAKAGHYDKPAAYRVAERSFAPSLPRTG